MRRAADAWRLLSGETKAGWSAYAKKYGDLISEQLYKDLSNWGVFLPAFRNRELLGLPAAETPLNAAPPAAITEVEEVASSDERTFTFRIHHSLAGAQGDSTVNSDNSASTQSQDFSNQQFVVLARITAAMPSVAQTPTSHVARFLCGHNASSTAPLPVTGGTVTFTNARFGIVEGERYGVELRIVRAADGIHSRPIFVDLIRKGTAAQETPPDSPAGERTTTEPETDHAAVHVAAQPPRTIRALPQPTLFAEHITPHDYPTTRPQDVPMRC